MYKKKRNNSKLAIFLLIIVATLVGIFYVHSDPKFERIVPTIDMKETIYWNPSKPFDVEISDQNGLKEIKAFLDDGTNEIELARVNLDKGDKVYKLRIDFPKIGILAKENLLKLTIEATDRSFWNFFKGNSTIKKSIIHIDKKRPNLLLVNNSYSITKGGAALVIFRVLDKNLKSFYIETNFNKKFYANSFYKDGYFISLVAWPIEQDSFKAWIVAFDKANNKSRQRVPFFLKNREYRVSLIQAKDSFIDGKIADLSHDREDLTKNLTPIEKMKFINEKYRIENEDIIRKYATKIDSNRIDNFDIKKFYPLKNGQRVGSYGDHRYYYYKSKDNIISESYHMGLDLASIKQAKIKTDNSALCVYSSYNGIYGNNVILYHGLGLYTIYGHCSATLVKQGDLVDSGQYIAQTGATGLALGDHLHFGISVQGVFTRPEEWMDRKWIHANITNIIQKAKETISD
jgi:murein DD-endopeptidase MepM/ murein hydrolase activator NlpD